MKIALPGLGLLAKYFSIFLLIALLDGCATLFPGNLQTSESVGMRRFEILPAAHVSGFTGSFYPGADSAIKNAHVFAGGGATVGYGFDNDKSIYVSGEILSGLRSIQIEPKFTFWTSSSRMALSLPIFMIWKNSEPLTGSFMRVYRDLYYDHNSTLGASLLVMGAFLNPKTDSLQIMGALLDVVYVRKLADDIEARAGIGFSPLSLILGAIDARASAGVSVRFK